MKPVFHPSIDDIQVEAILHALSDPVRAAIYCEIHESEAAQICADFVNIRSTPIPKSSLSLHFKILREAGLIHSRRNGVELRSTSRCAVVNERFPGLIKAIVGAHKVQMTETKTNRWRKRGRTVPLG